MAFNIFSSLINRDERQAILLRYASDDIPENLLDCLNKESCNCRIIKNNFTEHAFLVRCSKGLVEIIAQFDVPRYCYVISSFKELPDESEASIEFGKVQYIERELLLAVKSEKKNYFNPNTASPTGSLYMEIEQQESYDAKIEELKRQEEILKREAEEDANAEKQLEVWRLYIKRKQTLLGEARRPFVVVGQRPKLEGNFVDLETSNHYDSVAGPDLLNEIAEELGCSCTEDKLVMSLTQFKDFIIDDEREIKILGKITCSLTAACCGFWDAKNFKLENNYGREFYYDKHVGGEIPLTYTQFSPDAIIEFYQKACDSYYFTRVSPADEAKVQFKVKVSVDETDEQRQQRLNLLSKYEIYSKPDSRVGVLLGTLAKGSDRRHIRIKFPNDTEKKKQAKDFLKIASFDGLFLYPETFKEANLLERESDALEKLIKVRSLQNDGLRNFIFNSSRAKATEIFSGLSSEQIASTPQYIECQNTCLQTLNPSQQEAVVKALYAEDLCLLQGPPGTGKTTVISELIWQHIRQNQKVRMMLTSQTNLAIDNALNRLFGEFNSQKATNSWRNKMLIKPLRIADSDVVEDEGQPFTEEYIDSWCKGEEGKDDNIVAKWMQHISHRVSEDSVFVDILSEWKESLFRPTNEMRMVFAKQYKNDYNILGMTCTKVDSSAFKRSRWKLGYDVVIIDEASKATPPELLMPLCYAKKSIIIGDHRQLPPVIFEEKFFERIKEADPELEKTLDAQFRKDLVEQSLFKRLITHPYVSPTIKATFNEQYRMHPKINAVVSQFYEEDTKDGGGLHCGLNPISVDAPSFEEKSSRYHGLSYKSFIRPDVHTIWVDVLDGNELGEDTSSYNDKEAYAVRLVLEALSQADGFKRYMDYWNNYPNAEQRITEGRIGIISFYARQLQEIRNNVQDYCKGNSIRHTIKSVDKFQGQESGIIIVSTVKTKKLGFTKTPERLNVALSRARRLLIIVGNSKFYASDRAKTDDGKYIYRNVIDEIKSSGVFIDYHDLETLLGYERNEF